MRQVQLILFTFIICGNTQYILHLYFWSTTLACLTDGQIAIRVTIFTFKIAKFLANRDLFFIYSDNLK